MKLSSKKNSRKKLKLPSDRLVNQLDVLMNSCKNKVLNSTNKKHMDSSKIVLNAIQTEILERVSQTLMTKTSIDCSDIAEEFKFMKNTITSLNDTKTKLVKQIEECSSESSELEILEEKLQSELNQTINFDSSKADLVN